MLSHYHWPGNVREMENFIERALLVAEGDVLRIEAGWLAPPASSAARISRLVDVERQAITEALINSHGRVYGPRGAAAILGVKPTTLYAKMQKHGIPKFPAVNDGPS
jgi:formate hydrogenlyase transcriptional activator